MRVLVHLLITGGVYSYLTAASVTHSTSIQAPPGHFHRATTMLSLAKRVREAVTPARKTSAFLSQGVLTPAEFVEAGEQLVFKCPTWTW